MVFKVSESWSGGAQEVEGGLRLKCCPRRWGVESPSFLVASGLRILLRFAGFCRDKLLIFFVVKVADGTHNLLVPGLNPGGPTNEINNFRSNLALSNSLFSLWLRLDCGPLRCPAC